MKGQAALPVKGIIAVVVDVSAAASYTPIALQSLAGAREYLG